MPARTTSWSCWRKMQRESRKERSKIYYVLSPEIRHSAIHWAAVIMSQFRSMRCLPQTFCVCLVPADHCSLDHMRPEGLKAITVIWCTARFCCHCDFKSNHSGQKPCQLPIGWSISATALHILQYLDLTLCFSHIWQVHQKFNWDGQISAESFQQR